MVLIFDFDLEAFFYFSPKEIPNSNKKSQMKYE